MTVSYGIHNMSESLPLSIQFVAGGLLLILLSFIYSTLTSERPHPSFPVISLSEKGLGPKASFFRHGKDTIIKGIAQTNGPFQIVTGTGPKIVVPNRFADELKSHDALNFNEAFAKDFFAEYPGFEAHRQGLQGDNLIQEIVRVKLTQSLGLITGDLVEETTASIHDYFGEDSEWHATLVKQNVLDMVTRLSSRVFLGKELCRNERWLQIAKDYTIDSFIGARLLRLVPSVLRPAAHWVMPHCIRLRREYADANKLILPEVERRKECAEKAIAAGGKPPKTADTIGWMYEVARGRKIDYVAAQLSLTMAAIHTTTEAITQALLDVCANPEVMQPLRDEVIQVVGIDGWSKTALYKLRLMDSFLKESQRFHPPGFASMNRMVKANIQLSDGTTLPAGARIMLAPKYSDPTVYTDPGKFDPHRFLREREKPGQNNSWQHVTTSAHHMGFGHGQHACPGRFFASNEIKIALAHLLLKYEWQFDGSGPSPEMEFEGSSMTDPKAKLLMKRRREEINLDGQTSEA
ncbi:hypothetical protein LTR85_003022 [Meristemomyces frigidus]|nr:hypothetical protein LTR85_003022 [Meristemomyces frigidus]